MMKNPLIIILMTIIILLFFSFESSAADTTPPQSPVKLIFIHHSVGENWLADNNGGLGKSLGENNYFVSDTNYGWGPGGIGDRTDIVHWPEWFTGPQSETILRALYQESGEGIAKRDYFTRPMANPGGENDIVIFKSCFPNSNLAGNPDDPPGDGPDMTVAGAKYVYNQLLNYFGNHPEKLFIAITPPPETAAEYAEQAEGFSTWLTTQWLSDYSGNNVGVFDLHAVLSSPDNHHTIEGNTPVYVTSHGNTLAYPTEDAHPSAIGNRKATIEFLPLLNYYYNRWNSGRATNLNQPETTSDVIEPLNISVQTGDGASDTFDTGAIQPVQAEIPDSGEITGSWVTYDDGNSKITYIPSEDSSGFCVDMNVLASGWTSVENLLHEKQDWSGYSGISYHITADKAGEPYSLVLYSVEGPDIKTTYHAPMSTPATLTESEEPVQVRWSDLTPMDGTGTYDPKKAGGLFFSFGGEGIEDVRICISHLKLIS